MNWLNLEIRTLRSPAYIGSDPTERATWINLLAFCCEQENGGRIVGARGWKDRQWQQLCAVTMREVSRATKLTRWDGDDLLVFGYNMEKQEEVQRMRAVGQSRSDKKSNTARVNGVLGGRPKTQRDGLLGNPTETEREQTQHNPTETHRKEVEGERKEKGIVPPPSQDPPTRERPIVPTKAEAIAAAARCGIPTEAAECWWLDCDSRGLSPSGFLIDAKGAEIRNWQSAMTSYGHKWRSNNEQRKHAKPHAGSANQRNAGHNAGADYSTLPERPAKASNWSP